MTRRVVEKLCTKKFALIFWPLLLICKDKVHKGSFPKRLRLCSVWVCVLERGVLKHVCYGEGPKQRLPFGAFRCQTPVLGPRRPATGVKNCPGSKSQ